MGSIHEIGASLSGALENSKNAGTHLAQVEIDRGGILRILQAMLKTVEELKDVPTEAYDAAQRSRQNVLAARADILDARSTIEGVAGLSPAPDLQNAERKWDWAAADNGSAGTNLSRQYDQLHDQGFATIGNSIDSLRAVIGGTIAHLMQIEGDHRDMARYNVEGADSVRLYAMTNEIPITE